MEAGAKTLVTACPYCITMLEESSSQNLGKQDDLRVVELSELVAERL